MKVYAVIENWGYECEFGEEVEIFDTKEKAIEYIKGRKQEILQENSYNTIEDEEESFCAYEEERYRDNHIDIYIREKEVK